MESDPEKYKYFLWRSADDELRSLREEAAL